MFFLNRFNLIVIPPLKILHFDIFFSCREIPKGTSSSHDGSNG